MVLNNISKKRIRLFIMISIILTCVLTTTILFILFRPNVYRTKILFDLFGILLFSIISLVIIFFSDLLATHLPDYVLMGLWKRAKNQPITYKKIGIIFLIICIIVLMCRISHYGFLEIIRSIESLF